MGVDSMPITEILERNSVLYGNDVCLVEINPERKIPGALHGKNTS